MNKSPIFIGGLMKSGTSLLRVLLARHPNIFGGLETHWFSSDILQNWRDSNLSRNKLLRDFYEVPEDIYKNLQDSAADGIDFFSRFMEYCTRRAEKQRWVEKTPDNILQLPLIQQTWPSAKFIHVVRDYRDVYASWKKNQKRDLSFFLEQVHRVMAVVGDLVGSRTDFYMEIDYQDLVLDTTNTLRDILEHIDEPWVKGIDSYTGDSQVYEKVLNVVKKSSSTALSLKKPIFSTSIGQWKKILSPEEVLAIETNLGNL